MYIYDVEILGKNFFSAIFINPQTKEEIVCWKLDYNECGLEKLHSIVQNNLLIGYNCKYYDDIILNYIITQGYVDTYELYYLSQKIIRHQKKKIGPLWKDETIGKYMNGVVQSVDLMKMLAFGKMKVSLKHISSVLRFNKIKDLPHPHDEIVTLDKLEEILAYNKNDVLATLNLYNKVKDLLNMRFHISKKFKIKPLRILNASKTDIGKEILNTYYKERTGLDRYEFVDLRTNRGIVRLKECISDKVKYETELFNNMLNNFNNTIVYIEKDKDPELDYSIIYKNRGYKMGFGGLHSMDDVAIFNSDDNYEIIDADVDSYYPRVMLQYKIKPEHVDEVFFSILDDMTELRLKAKKKDSLTGKMIDPITADSMKITINAIFGLYNFPEYWLYDTKAAYSVTINGQMFLLMLIEKLALAGFDVISANTDGITTLVRKDRKEEYHKICKDWENYTKFTLSFTTYLKYVRKDVNNYTVLKDGGETKEKGCFNYIQDLEKGYNTSIIPIALNNYFLKGIPIKDTLFTHRNIFDFCKSQKIGGQFTSELHYLKDNVKTIEVLQKTNRYFISKKGGTFIKRKDDGSLHNLELDWQVTLLNDYDESKLDEYLTNIDYRYYIDKCNKIIESIEDKQLKFDWYV